MKKVFIKYNPFKLETEIIVEDKKLAQNSKLGELAAPGSRLQQWVENLPRILIDEYNDIDFQVLFHGTLPDYEDLADVFIEAHERGELTATLERRPAKETTDKEVLIDDVFNEIQAGPFDELRDVEIISAFNHAKSSDFEVCVVATMSAGKSTLINAMLGTKLMPSKQEACTAIITRIKDTSQEEIPWEAEVYNKESVLVETHEQLTYPTMERLNADENVSAIKIAGNIPFVATDDVSLVLIDTPGPNNSRDPHHKKVQSEFLSKSSKSLVLYIMTGEFGTDDDNALLKRVAESMAVGGKQSKDRFIFVVNKLDDRKKEDGDTAETLNRVRAYLKTHGVANPNLFPIAALPALYIRQKKNNVELDEETLDDIFFKVRKLNRIPANGNAPLHFETYASLPQSLQGEVNQAVLDAKANYDDEGEALIHTGIPSVEAAIRQYVQKYAKTAKIKNIVDTFMHKLDEVGCFEETKRELIENQKESKKIVEQIEMVRKKIDDAKSAKKFKNAVDNAVVKVNDDSRDVVESIIKKFQVRITKKIDNLRGQELDVDDAQDEVERLDKFAKRLIPDFEVELDELVRENLIKTGSALIEEYRQKLISLTEEMDFEEMGISIDPLKLMGGSVVPTDFSFQHLIREDRRVTGTETYEVKEQTRGWFESFAFWPKNEYVTKTRNIYKTVRYIDGSVLAQQYLAPMQEALYDNGDNAQKFALKQSKRIADKFNTEFKRLDDILKEKLAELESFATDQRKADERIKETERKLQWLEAIKTKVESILEI